MPMLPFGDYRPDRSAYQGASSQIIQNVVPRGDGYGPFADFTAFTSALPAACRGFFYARKTDGSIAVFAGTSTKLYQLANTDFSWTDVSKSGGSYSVLPSSDHWQFAQFGNLVIAVQANTAPQVFDLTSSSAFADLGGSPPQARYIAIVGRFVVLSGLLSTPYRIQWSGLNGVTTWTAGVGSSDYQDLPDGGIVRGVAGGEYGVILQETAIRRMVFAPGSPVIFNIERITEDKGLMAPYSLIRTADKIFFLSPQGFQGMVSTGAPAAIGKERFDRTFFADFDSGSIQMIIGAADPAATRVYWAYKSNSGTTGQFDKVLCYDYALDRASIIATRGEYLASLARPGLTLESLDSISGSIDALPFSLDDVSTAALSKLSAVSTAHKLGFFTGGNLEATLDTAEQTLGRRVRVKGLRPVTDAAACYGSVGARENLQSGVSYSAEQGVNAKGLCPANVSTRLARGRASRHPRPGPSRRVSSPTLHQRGKDSDMSGNVPVSTEKDLFKIVRAVRELFEGRSNAVGTFTLSANAASTTVTAANCGAGSTVLLTPTSAHAATELGNGTIYVSSVANGSFTVTHANNSQTDRTFLYAALG